MISVTCNEIAASHVHGHEGLTRTSRMETHHRLQAANVCSQVCYTRASKNLINRHV